MRTPRHDSGFTLIELMIALLITTVIMGVAFSTFANALQLNEAVVLMADSSQNLRAGTNLLVRDLLQAGRYIPTGVSIPSGGAGAINRPGPTGQAYKFDNTTASVLSVITTGAGLGPIVDGRHTDMITILTDDPFLVPLVLSPWAAGATVPTLAIDGASFSVGTNVAWLAGDPANGVGPVKIGDLFYFQGTGSTLQTVTNVQGSTVSFETGDPFNLNQRGAPAGSITQILGSPLFTARRMLMYTYYVYEESPGVPRLMRRLNMFPHQALAGVIEDLQFRFDLVDGVTNPTDISDLPYTDPTSHVTYSSSQIRKVNLRIGVRSETKTLKTQDYVRNHVSTMISLRNLAFVDRYK